MHRPVLTWHLIQTHFFLFFKDALEKKTGISEADVVLKGDSSKRSRSPGPGVCSGAGQKPEHVETASRHTMSKQQSQSEFDSSSYTGGASHTVISTLIERGMRLKNEMLRTAVLPAPASFSDTDPDVSGLSHEPLLYDGYLFMPSTGSKNRQGDADDDHYDDDDEAELRELLEPRELFHTRTARLRRRADLASDDDSAAVKSSPPCTRVSFEMQSSDAESTSSFGGDSSCYDVLSAARLGLLNLVQVAKLHLDKMVLYPKTNISMLVEQTNRPELQLPSSPLKIPATGKPPIPASYSSSNQDPNQLFFIEYQFPVLANSRDSNSTAPPTMATQSMRVVSKRY